MTPDRPIAGRGLLWRGLLLFVAGCVAGNTLAVAVGALASWAGIAFVSDHQSILMYGPAALLLNCLLVGTISCGLGALLTRRFRDLPPSGYFLVAGVIYCAAAFLAAMFLPMPRGSVAGQMFASWLLLFPAVAVAAGALRR